MPELSARSVNFSGQKKKNSVSSVCICICIHLEPHYMFNSNNIFIFSYILKPEE